MAADPEQPTASVGPDPVEVDRIRALDALALLDSGADPSYDAITELAAQVCGTPWAVIALVAADRQYLKSAYGVNAKVLPRDWTFLNIAHAGRRAIIFEDTRLHPDTAVHPMVTGQPFLRFTAVVPLRVAGGQAVGTLAVADKVPHRLDTNQIRHLEMLGRQVEQLFSLRSALVAETLNARRASMLEDRFQRVIQSVDQGVMVFTTDGQVERVNRAGMDILGRTEEELHELGPLHESWIALREDGTLFPVADRPSIGSLRSGSETRGVIMGVPKPDGDVRWMQVSSSPLTDGGDQPAGAVATFVDITDLRDLNAKLQRSLDELAGAYQEKAALVSAVSHDLRAPLAAIRIMTDLLDGRHDDLSDADRSNLIQRIRSDAHRTEGALSDLVGVDRLTSGLTEPRRSPVDLGHLIVRYVDEFHTDGHTVIAEKADSMVVVSADIAQLERILDNLISNGLRHTPTGTTITLSCRVDGDRARIEIADNGPGVPGIAKDRIFQPYERGTDAVNRPGSGIGLFLVRQFARFHGGDAWCEDVAGGGARFVVTISGLVDAGAGLVAPA